MWCPMHQETEWDIWCDAPMLTYDDHISETPILLIEITVNFNVNIKKKLYRKLKQFTTCSQMTLLYQDIKHKIREMHQRPISHSGKCHFSCGVHVYIRTF